MQKNNVKIMAVSAVVIVICLLASWQYTSVDGDVDDSRPFAEGLVGGDVAAAYELLVPELKAEYEPLGGAEYFGVLLSTLQYSTELQYGPYVSIGETYSPESGISCTPMTYAYSGALVWTHTGDEGVDAFYITPRELPNGNAVPEGIVETSVQVGADDMKALARIPHSGIAGTADLGEKDCVHIRKKLKVAQRLAWMALANDYGIRGLPRPAPTFSHFDYADDDRSKMVLHFDNLCGDRTWFEPDSFDTFENGRTKTPGGFEVAGEDRVWHKAEAAFGKYNNMIQVWSDEVEHPVAVRYAFHNFCPEANVVTTYGQPLMPFRTDDWPVTDLRCPKPDNE